MTNSAAASDLENGDRFDFGENWSNYSRQALTQERFDAAGIDFDRLMEGIDLDGRRFLDIGFGQGLSLILASDRGASCVGCDIDPRCATVFGQNCTRFSRGHAVSTPLVVGSFLDSEVQRRLRSHAPAGYDIVHSWGALHHTGDLWRALSDACGLVAAQGHLALAVYNRHWSSRWWRWIKWSFCKSPRFVQRVWIGALYPVIWLAKLAVTGRSPGHKSRGMDFYYDVVDWVGGYPYEFASQTEVIGFVERRGFDLVKLEAAEVPTGCNEFVFRRRDFQGS